MNITLELPQGAPPPKLTGTLTGPVEDLRIEIRLADLIETAKTVIADGGTVAMTNPATGKLHTFKALKPEPQPKPAAAKAAQTKRVAVAPTAKPQNKPETAATNAKPAPNREAVVAFLSQGPATRVEVIKNVAAALHTTEQSVEQAFYACKDLGLIEKFADEKNGGLPKWRLVTKK